MFSKVWSAECIRQGGELMSRDGCLSPNSIGPDSPFACLLHFLLHCAALTHISVIFHWPALFSIVLLHCTSYILLYTHCTLLQVHTTICSDFNDFPLDFSIFYCATLLHTATYCNRIKFQGFSIRLLLHCAAIYCYTHIAAIE